MAGRFRLLAAGALALSLAGTAALVAWFGAAAIGHDVVRALPALPAALAIHLTQLFLAGLAWRSLMARPPSPMAMFRTRWVREAANSLLPFAGIGGGVVGARMLGRRLGTAEAAAVTTGDLTLEALAQIAFLILSLLVVAWLAPARFVGRDAAWAVLPIGLGVAAFVVLQRMGLMRLVERGAARLGLGAAFAGLHEHLMVLHGERGRVARALLLHLASWSLGGAEVWVVLKSLGLDVGALQAFAIEGLGMAARSAGFALPAGLAAQEAGFVVAGAALGVGAQDAIALSMVKRVRELIVAGAGIALPFVWR